MFDKRDNLVAVGVLMDCNRFVNSNTETCDTVFAQIYDDYLLGSITDREVYEILNSLQVGSGSVVCTLSEENKSQILTLLRKHKNRFDREMLELDDAE